MYDGLYSHMSVTVSHNVDTASMVIDEKNVDMCISFDVLFLSPNASISVVVEGKEGYYVLAYTTGTVSMMKSCGILTLALIPPLEL